MRKTVASLAIAAALTVGMAAPAMATPSHTAYPRVYSVPGVTVPPAVQRAITARHGIPACKTEDSNNCYWNAATMGTHRGYSFITWHDVTYRAAWPVFTSGPLLVKAPR